jgi:hypothetical protein
MPCTIDPGYWLPPILFYPIPRGGPMAARRDTITWPILLAARDGYRKAQARAWKRRWQKAYTEHSAQLARLDAVMAVFAPMMAGNPTLGFEDACARLSSQSLKAVQER